MAKRHWRKRQDKDRYFQQAKQEGYRARSAYKLEEINRKFRIIRRGDFVLDIGAAPGSWSQLAARLVGNKGRVVAVDLQQIEPIPGVTALQGDVREPACFEQIRAAAGDEPYNTVISDIAPNTTGIAITDHARSIELSLFAMSIALRTLRKGGNFTTKVFTGEDLDDLLALARRYFRRATLFSPGASRKESKETFLVANNLQARAELDPELGPAALLAVEPEPL